MTIIQRQDTVSGFSMRPMEERDREAVLGMMEDFYASPALLSRPEESVRIRDFEDCVGDCPFVRGYMLFREASLAGYAMTAESYSTEAGGRCLWIEDLYLLPEHRGKGLGRAFFEALHRETEGVYVRYRLEAEEENLPALLTYHKMGYRELGYIQLIRE